MELGASSSSPSAGGERSEIAFFDVETTVPAARGQGYALLEFGAVLVCPRRLVEVGCYSTLIRPADPSSQISPTSIRCNGITPAVVASAPSFGDVADHIFDILHGRVWAGHNIVRFDCARIREAFAEIGRPAPEAKGTIDTLPFLSQRFGRRAGDMKMASLATYFGLGQQRHRSLDDVRLNLEVLKYCAAVLFMESNLPNIFSITSGVHEARIPETNSDPPDLMAHIEQMKIDQPGDNMEEPTTINPHETFRTVVGTSDGCSSYSGYLEPNEVSGDCINVVNRRSGWRILLHKGVPVRLCSMGLRVQFGISSKFRDNAGRPKLSFVVNIPTSLSRVLEFCDYVARNSSLDAGSNSEWIPVMRKDGYSNTSSVRLHLPFSNGDGSIFSTEIYLREASGNVSRPVISKSDFTELEVLLVQLDLLLVPGITLDAFFCVDLYDYQQYAGIRLVAKRLDLYSR